METDKIQLKNSGQVMLLTVLVLSAVFLTATVIAGLLMVYQLSQVSAIADSAKSIFAADAAIERGLFKVFRCNPNPVLPKTGSWNIDVFCNASGLQEPISKPSIGIPAFRNQATYRLTIESKGGCGNHDPKATLSNIASIKGTGWAGKSARAFQANFGRSCK